MSQLKPRQRDILKRLYSSVAPLSTDELCRIYGVSLRTIRYDLAHIRDLLKRYDIELMMKSNVGHYLRVRDKALLFPLLESDDEHDERSGGLLWMLLVAKRPLSLALIARSFFLSESSVSKLMARLNEEVAPCSVLSTSTGYVLSGLEHDIRSLMTQRIYEHINKHFNLLDYYDVLPKEIKAVLAVDRFRLLTLFLDHSTLPYSVWLSQETFVQLLSHLITLEIRLNLGFVLVSPKVDNSASFDSERHFAEHLFHHLFEKHESVAEIEGFIDFLVSKGIFVFGADSKTSTVSHELVSSMMDYLKGEGYILDYETLQDDLTKHIAMSLKRQAFHKGADSNPLLNQIKTEHQEQYRLAEVLKEKVVDPSGVSYEVSEDELSYIAIYLYKNWMKQPELENPKVYVVCATSRGVSTLLETRIRHVFPQIEVLGTLSIQQMMQPNTARNADFIISTIPIARCAVPVIHVTQLLNVKDIAMIRRLLNFGVTARVIPEKMRVNEFIERQFKELGESYISIEKLTVVILHTLDALMSLEVGDQKILGILIHVLLALPRWFEAGEDSDTHAQDSLEAIASAKPSVYGLFVSVFDEIERELGVVLNSQERLSFFDYIFEREVDYEANTD